jgi:hypothetical protein
MSLISTSGKLHDDHREALLQEMHPALQHLYHAQAVLDGRFEVVDVLGAGGFATVLRCKDLKAPDSQQVYHSCLWRVYNHKSMLVY